jgi:hypothetical protein
MLIHETRRIVHLIMNNNVQILLRIVFGQFLVREFLVSHVFHCYYRNAKQAAVMIFFAEWFLDARELRRRWSDVMCGWIGWSVEKLVV